MPLRQNNGNEARNVAAVVFNDLIAETEDVHGTIVSRECQTHECRNAPPINERTDRNIAGGEFDCEAPRQDRMRPKSTARSLNQFKWLSVIASLHNRSRFLSWVNRRCFLRVAGIVRSRLFHRTKISGFRLRVNEFFLWSVAGMALEWRWLRGFLTNVDSD